jgi:hypothetical protein
MFQTTNQMNICEINMFGCQITLNATRRGAPPALCATIRWTLVRNAADSSAP